MSGKIRYTDEPLGRLEVVLISSRVPSTSSSVIYRDGPEPVAAHHPSERPQERLARGNIAKRSQLGRPESAVGVVRLLIHQCKP